MSPFPRAAVLAAALLFASGAAWSAAPLVLTLRSAVTLDHPAIVLGDLVDAAPGTPAAVLATPIGPAPRVGYVLRLRRADLAAQLRRQAGTGAVDWDGAPAVAVTTLTQRIAPELLRAAALAGLDTTFGEAGDTVAVALPDSAVDIPQRPYALRTRPIAWHGGARVLVWVDVAVDGAVYRSVVLPATVTRMRTAWVATHAMPAGSLVDRADFAPREVNVAGLDPLPDAPEAVAGARLRVALQAGQVLTGPAVAPAGAVFRGDPVQLLLNAGALAIAAPGVAQAAALPGQRVAVRSASSGELLSGRVSPAGAVIIE